MCAVGHAIVSLWPHNHSCAVFTASADIVPLEWIPSQVGEAQLRMDLEAALQSGRVGRTTFETDAVSAGRNGRATPELGGHEERRPSTDLGRRFSADLGRRLSGDLRRLSGDQKPRDGLPPTTPSFGRRISDALSPAPRSSLADGRHDQVA